MRKVHRCLSVIFGIFLLWIAGTGVLSQLAALKANGGFEKETVERGRGQAAAIGGVIVPPARAHEGEHEKAVVAIPARPGAAAFTCPADMTCRPKTPPSAARAWVGYLHHLHSGEQFGPAGVVISILSGLALLFFAFSGLWMYIQMFARRSHRKSHPRKLFW